MSVNGWDERDLKLWSAIRQLPSYGLIGSDCEDPMLSRKQVLGLLETHAVERFNRDWESKIARSYPAKAGGIQPGVKK